MILACFFLSDKQQLVYITLIISIPILLVLFYTLFPQVGAGKRNTKIYMTSLLSNVHIMPWLKAIYIIENILLS